LNSTLLIGCQQSAALGQIKKNNMADGQDKLEAVEEDQKLSESRKFALYKDLKGYRILWDTSFVLSKKQQQNKHFRGLSPSSLKPKQSPHYRP